MAGSAPVTKTRRHAGFANRRPAGRRAAGDRRPPLVTSSPVDVPGAAKPPLIHHRFRPRSSAFPIRRRDAPATPELTSGSRTDRTSAKVEEAGLPIIEKIAISTITGEIYAYRFSEIARGKTAPSSTLSSSSYYLSKLAWPAPTLGVMYSARPHTALPIGVFLEADKMPDRNGSAFRGTRLYISPPRHLLPTARSKACSRSSTGSRPEKRRLRPSRRRARLRESGW